MSQRRLIVVTGCLVVRTVRVVCAKLAFKAGLRALGAWLFPPMDAASQLRWENLKLELEQTRNGS